MSLLPGYTVSLRVIGYIRLLDRKCPLTENVIKQIQFVRKIINFLNLTFFIHYFVFLCWRWVRFCFLSLHSFPAISIICDAYMSSIVSAFLFACLYFLSLYRCFTDSLSLLHTSARYIRRKLELLFIFFLRRRHIDTVPNMAQAVLRKFIHFKYFFSIPEL